MSTEITHSDWLKIFNESSEHVSTVDFLSNRQMRKYFAITLRFISNEKLYNDVLTCRWSNGHHKTENIVTRRLEEIVSNFEITVLTHDFSALLDECSSLMDVVWLIKDLKGWCVSTVTNISKIYYFCLINIYSVCCSGVIYGVVWVKYPLPGKLKVTIGPPLSLYFGLSILLTFSKLLLYAFFGQFQRCTLVIGNDTHSKHFRKIVTLTWRSTSAWS